MRLTGITAPGLSTCLAVPGRQSTKYSPISDCGRDSQKLSLRSEPKPSLSILKPMSACLVRLSSLMSVILPARTPATFRSPPWMRPNALSSWTQYLPLSGFDPRRSCAIQATPTAATSEEGEQRALHGPSGPSDASQGKSASA